MISGFETKEMMERGMSFLLCMKDFQTKNKVAVPSALKCKILDLLREDIKAERSL